ncbi:MAG: thermonuclease family protein [Candidatus Pacebacteria bacterium]|nr:thermonuclease family protein [Candidatus Paceibacterota bacterium]
MKNEQLGTILAFVFVIFPFIAGYFLVKKNSLNKLLKNNWNRKKIFFNSLVVWFGLFIGAGVFLPPPADLPEINGVVGVNEIENNNNKINAETEVEQLEKVVVSRVVDGDTVELSDGRKLRYIGINTPETKDPNKDIECYGVEASRKNKELVEGIEVELEKDVSETDRYGRLLRYVYVNGEMINDLLVKEGFAQASAYPPDIKYQDKLENSEKEARENKKGLWGDICNQPVPTAYPTNQPTLLPTAKPVVYPASKSNQVVMPANKACKYSCSGPDRDCVDFSTHAEAVSFFNCCGFSVDNDPMKLDGVGVDDGEPCESLP